MTWPYLDDPNSELGSLIEGYFNDMAVVAVSTTKHLAEHTPVEEGPLAGYDGRLNMWLSNMLRVGASDGPERAWPIVVQLIERAPDEGALFYIAAGPLEALVNNHGDRFGGRIVEQAAREPRFRFALAGVWPDEDAPSRLRDLIWSARRSLDAPSGRE